MTKKKAWVGLIIGFAGAILGLFGVLFFNQSFIMSMPIWLRMIGMIVIYWLIALIPVVVVLAGREKIGEYGFTKEKLGHQIVIGILIGAAMSLAFTLIPHLLGFGSYVSSGKGYRFLWQFIYEFIYCISAIGFVEEFVFRGFIYKKILDISMNETVAVIGSSVLFGAFHFFGGNIIQMMVTACFGALWCLCRSKIQNCTILSLIIAHGIYDALITVWTCVFSQ